MVDVRTLYAVLAIVAVQCVALQVAAFSYGRAGEPLNDTVMSVSALPLAALALWGLWRLYRRFRPRDVRLQLHDRIAARRHERAEIVKRLQDIDHEQARDQALLERLR